MANLYSDLSGVVLFTSPLVRRPSRAAAAVGAVAKKYGVPYLLAGGVLRTCTSLTLNLISSLPMLRYRLECLF